MIKLKINLIEDWKKILLEEIKTEGFEFEENSSTDEVILHYITYLRKIGKPTQKEVFYSNEITQTLAGFPKDSLYREAIKMIAEKLKTNESIRAHLSKKIENLFENDGLFNDWGILHAHLGTSADNNNPNFVERTGPLLFLLLKSDKAYFVDIYQHGDWTKTSILQTLYNNWPHLLNVLPFENMDLEHGDESFRIFGVVSPTVLKDDENNEVYVLPPGIGMTTAGTPLGDTNTLDDIQRILDQMQQEIKESIKSNTTLKNRLPKVSTIQLVRNNDVFKIIEINTQLTLKTFALNI